MSCRQVAAAHHRGSANTGLPRRRLVVWREHCRDLPNSPGNSVRPNHVGMNQRMGELEFLLQPKERLSSDIPQNLQRDYLRALCVPRFVDPPESPSPSTDRSFNRSRAMRITSTSSTFTPSGSLLAAMSSSHLVGQRIPTTSAKPDTWQRANAPQQRREQLRRSRVPMTRRVVCRLRPDPESGAVVRDFAPNFQ